MEGYYCKDISQAKEKMLELIGPKSKSVAYGGSMTLTDNGFFAEVKKAGHNLSLVVEKLGY